MNAGLRGSPERSRHKASRKGMGTFSGYGGRVGEDRCSGNNHVALDSCEDCWTCAGVNTSSLLTFAQRPDTWQYMLAQLPLEDLAKMPQLCRGIAEGAPFDNPNLPFWRWMVMERAPGAVLLREFWCQGTRLICVWEGLLGKMNQDLPGMACQPWRDILQSVLKLGFHGQNNENAARSVTKQARAAISLKEVEFGLATLAARLMLGKDHLKQKEWKLKQQQSQNGGTNQTLREYFNAQVSYDNDVADMISWLYSISHGVSFSELQDEDKDCDIGHKNWQELMQRVVRGVVVPGLISVLDEQPPLVEIQPDSRMQRENEGSPSFAIAIASPLSLMEAVLGRVLATGIAFSAVLAHDDVARVAACSSASRSTLLRIFFHTFLESFGATYPSSTSGSSMPTQVPGGHKADSTSQSSNMESKQQPVMPELSNQSKQRIQPTASSVEGPSTSSAGQHTRHPVNGLLATESAEGNNVKGEAEDVCRALPTEAAELMSKGAKGVQELMDGLTNEVESDYRDGVMRPEDTSPESSSREGGGEETLCADSCLAANRGNSGCCPQSEDVASISASSFIASLFQRMKLGRVETICFSTSWKCAGFEAAFRQAADSVLYEIFGLKLSAENENEEPLKVPRPTKCDRAPNDVEIRVWSPGAHKLKGAILPAGCVHSSAFLLRTAEAVAEANNVSESPWPRDVKRSSHRTAVIRNTIGEELKANYRSWTKAKEWVVLADVKVQQQLQQQNLWQLQQTRNRLLMMMREHEQLLLEYRPLIQDQQLPPDRREHLRRICQDAMERLAHDHEHQVRLQQMEEQLILRQQEQEEAMQHQALEERLMQREFLNQSGQQRKVDSLRKVTSALPFIRIQVVFPPVGRGMTLVSLVRAIMENVSQLDEDGQEEDGPSFENMGEDNMFADPQQRAIIESFFGVS